MSVRVPVLVVAAYALLSLSWLFANPAGSSPDEMAHYLKALDAGHGRLHLTDRQAPPDPQRLAAQTVQERWHERTARLVHVSADLDPKGLLCTAFKPERSAACLLHRPEGTTTAMATIVGTYQPYMYVLPGVLMRFGSDPFSATWLGRSGFWVVSSLLVGLAVFLLWSPDDGGYSLLGLLLAVTPMVVFMSSSLSANATEICAGICFLAAVVRLSRGREEPGWVWVAAALSGALLALARSTGALWVVLAGLVLLAMVGRREAVAIVVRGGRRAAGAAVAVGLSAVAGLAWEVIVQPHPDRTISAALHDVPVELRTLPTIYRESLGVFGWLDTAMYPFAYWLWTILLMVVIVLALLVAHRRQRLVLCALVVSCVAVTVGLGVLNQATGFGMQGRYVLAFVVVVPLVAGETLFVNRSRLGRLEPRWLPAGVAAVVALVQLGGWYSNAKRYAVGTNGPRLFIADAEWRPPMGWAPWLVLAVVGVTALFAAILLGIRQASTFGPDPRRLTPAENPTGAVTSRGRD